MYRLTLNDFAMRFFGIEKRVHEGHGIGALVEGVLGKENCDKYMMSQDPLCGGKTVGEIRICLDKDEPDHHRPKFVQIGKIEKIS